MEIVKTRLIVPLILAAVTGACAPQISSIPDTTVSLRGTVTGSALYRERILPPPGASVKFSLEDVSRADAPSVTLASQEYNVDGKAPPYAFKLTTPHDRLDTRMTYSVRASIADPHGKLLWTSDAAHRIDPSAIAQELPPIIMVKVN